MDLATLLAPIAADQPAGPDLSFSPEIDRVQEMRREDDPTLDQGEWVSALKAADWPGVARHCEQILATRSKDLRVSSWLVDAWARLQGFAGLADGLDLSAGLIERYWDDLHPRPDAGDMEERAGNLRWLAARIAQLACTIPLVARDGQRSSSSLIAIEAARASRVAGIAAAGQTLPTTAAAPGGGAPLTLEAVWRDVRASGRDGSQARRALLTRTHTALLRLESSIDARFADDAPSFVAARATLDKGLEELQRLDRECGHLEPVADAAAGEIGTLGVDAPMPGQAAFEVATATAPSRPARIDNRAQALEQLRLVSAYFRRTEPHSPVAYLADKAVRWSEMPLHEWLRAVMKDGASLAHLEEMLGVDKPPEAA